MLVLPRRSSSRKKHVQAIGAYGFKNFGDELFVSTIKENSAALWPDSVLKTFVPNYHRYSSPHLIGRLLRLLTALFGYLWADTIAMCGGSTLEDVKGIDKIRQYFLKYRRVEALGVSVGPFTSEDAGRRIQRTVNNMDRLIVRDQRSLIRLRAIGANVQASVGGDLVALSYRVGPRKLSTSNLITICPSAAANVPIEDLTRNVLSALEKYVEISGTMPKIRLLALSQHPTSNDIPLCRSLRRGLVSENYIVKIDSFEDLGIDGTCRAIAESEMVWSYRLHGAIVAYLSEIPFLIIGHHEKCVDFAEDIGLNEATFLTASSSWDTAVEVLMNGASPTLGPKEYRARARSVYLGGISFQ